MRIEMIEKNMSNWMYFWTKTITSINLNQHCAKTFNGDYLNGNIIETKEKDVYICGVSKPFSYGNNLHVALKEKIGNNITIHEKDVVINVYDAERIEVIPLAKGESHHESGNRKEFWSCRNWQYGHQVLSAKSEI